MKVVGEYYYHLYYLSEASGWSGLGPTMLQSLNTTIAFIFFLDV